MWPNAISIFYSQVFCRYSVLLIGTVAFSAFTTKLLQLKTQNSCPCDAITRELKQRIDRRKTDLQTNENETLQGGVSNNTLNREVEKKM